MTGTSAPMILTFLFTDVESSTRLWERRPDAMKAALEHHDAILRDAIEGSNGRVIKTTGDGLMSVFSSAADGVEACLRAQQGLSSERWDETGPLRVRMGMHAGEAQIRAGDFFGPPVYRAARIMAAAHGGQILLSALAAELARERLPAEARLRDLGEHRLRDLLHPEHVFQLVHPRLETDFPPLRALGSRPNNLPTQTSEFLGREPELASIRELLHVPGVRLVTLTGPGGTGKTRLALQAASEQIDRFEDGSYFVDLSPVRESDAAFEAVVRALGLTVTSDERPIEVLKQQLRTGHVLLLLDNFEQVMDAVDGVADLLQHCLQVKILVTSRAALRLRGEHLFPVPPLSLPQVRGAQMSADTLAGYEAVRLFVERAREVQPAFVLTDDNANAVAEICTRLDGLPLAIELAAARLRLFSPEELRDRLRDRLRLLRGGPRDLPTRQQTLRGTIEWSYELLDAEERALFRLLSVFSPTRVEAVESVAARLEPLEDSDVLDRLTSLVDKSLVRSVDGLGGPRLSMLETIREYAAERLEEEPELSVAARRAHAEYFSDFASRTHDRLYGPERKHTLGALESEIGNLLTAWRHWVAEGDLEQLNKLVQALWVLHDARGWYHAAVGLTKDMLGVLSTVPSSPDRAGDELMLRASLARGLLALRGYTEEVDEAYRGALSLLKEAGELPQRFHVLRSVASFYLYRAEPERAAAVGRELLAFAEEQNDAALGVDAHIVLGTNLAFVGEVGKGLDHLERAIELFDPDAPDSRRFRLGPNPGVLPYTASAFLLWLLGYPDRAVERAATAVEVAHRLGHPYTLAYTLFHVGFFDLWRRELELVHERASGVLEIAKEHDYHIWRALALVLQGVAMTGLGDVEEGLLQTDQGLALYQGLKTPPMFWPLLLFIKGEALALGGRPADGLGPVDRALEMTTTFASTPGSGGRNPLEPELLLLKGDLLLAVSDVDGAEACFKSALDAAESWGGRMSRLRAATRLTRLWRAVGRRPDGSDVLRNIYGQFTEGLDTPDLVEARALLDGLDTRAV
jgi:predicted ATPase/class 3 adenylate cyclase